MLESLGNSLRTNRQSEPQSSSKSRRANNRHGYPALSGEGGIPIDNLKRKNPKSEQGFPDPDFGFRISRKGHGVSEQDPYQLRCAASPFEQFRHRDDEAGQQS